jgi:hypothetical protein
MEEEDLLSAFKIVDNHDTTMMQGGDIPISLLDLMRNEINPVILLSVCIAAILLYVGRRQIVEMGERILDDLSLRWYRYKHFNRNTSSFHVVMDRDQLLPF